MFRGNTLATLLMDQFMSMVAVPYRQATLKDTVQYVIQLEQPCEVRKQGRNTDKRETDRQTDR